MRGKSLITTLVVLGCAYAVFMSASSLAVEPGNVYEPFDGSVVEAKSLHHAADRYRITEGTLPEDIEALKRYCFFEPVIEIAEWKLEGDVLEFSVNMRWKDGFKLKAFRLSRPGSEAEKEAIEKRRNRMARSCEQEPERWPDWVTAEDILVGRFSKYADDKIRGHAGSVEEFPQVYWSCDLANLLSMTAVMLYAPAHDGHYPADAGELIAFIGKVNEEGWMAPVTGGPVKIVSVWDGKNVLYRVNEDCTGFEIRVPLFGAGVAKSTMSESWGDYDGWFPGEYVRRSSGMGDNTFINY